MSRSIHITTARKILDAGDPVDLKVWTKDGRILEMHNVVSLRYSFRSGTRRVKVLASRQIRTIRDVLVFEINNSIVYL